MILLIDWVEDEVRRAIFRESVVIFHHLISIIVQIDSNICSILVEEILLAADKFRASSPHIIFCIFLRWI